MHELWRLTFALSTVMRGHLERVCAEFGLTPPQAYALAQLEPARPRPMHELAAGLRCDASNVTGIANRLEARGLIRRQPSKTDRRVRALMLTDDGEQLRRALLARLAETPPPLTVLDDGDRQALTRLIATVVEGS